MQAGRAIDFWHVDVADHLDSPEMVAAFLSAAIEGADGDMATIISALNTAVRAGNMSQLARTTGMCRESLCKALSAEGNPSFELVSRIVDSFGLRLAVVPAGE